MPGSMLAKNHFVTLFTWQCLLVNSLRNHILNSLRSASQVLPESGKTATQALEEVQNIKPFLKGHKITAILLIFLSVILFNPGKTIPIIPINRWLSINPYQSWASWISSPLVDFCTHWYKHLASRQGCLQAGLCVTPLLSQQSLLRKWKHHTAFQERGIWQNIKWWPNWVCQAGCLWYFRRKLGPINTIH